MGKRNLNVRRRGQKGNNSRREGEGKNAVVVRGSTIEQSKGGEKDQSEEDRVDNNNSLGSSLNSSDPLLLGLGSSLVSLGSLLGSTFDVLHMSGGKMVLTLGEKVTLASVTGVTVSKLEDEGGEEGDKTKERSILFQIHVEDGHPDRDASGRREESMEEERNLLLGGDFVGGHIGVQEGVILLIFGGLHHFDNKEKRGGGGWRERRE